MAEDTPLPGSEYEPCEAHRFEETNRPVPDVWLPDGTFDNATAAARCTHQRVSMLA